MATSLASSRGGFRSRTSNSQGGGGSALRYGTRAWAVEHAPLALEYADGLMNGGKAKTAYEAFTDPPDGVLSKKGAPTEDSWLLPEGFESHSGRSARLFFDRECVLWSEKAKWCGIFSCKNCTRKNLNGEKNYFTVALLRGLSNLDYHASSCYPTETYKAQMDAAAKLPKMKGAAAGEAMKKLMDETFCLVSLNLNRR
jgi:hypothetical protein